MNSYEILTFMKSYVVYIYMKKKKGMKLIYSRFEISDVQGIIMIYIYL